jgi:hypothetical protein
MVWICESFHLETNADPRRKLDSHSMEFSVLRSFRSYEPYDIDLRSHNSSPVISINYTQVRENTFVVSWEKILDMLQRKKRNEIY